MAEKDLLKNLIEKSYSLNYQDKKALAQYLLDKAREEEQQELAQLSEEEKRQRQRIRNQAALDFLKQLQEDNSGYEEENWPRIQEAIEATRRKSLSNLDRAKEEVKTLTDDEQINLLEYLLEKFVKDCGEERNKEQQEEGKQAIEKHKGEFWISEDFDEPMELVESKVYEKLKVYEEIIKTRSSYKK